MIIEGVCGENVAGIHQGNFKNRYKTNLKEIEPLPNPYIFAFQCCIPLDISNYEFCKII